MYLPIHCCLLNLTPNCLFRINCQSSFSGSVEFFLKSLRNFFCSIRLNSFSFSNINSLHELICLLFLILLRREETGLVPSHSITSVPTNHVLANNTRSILLLHSLVRVDSCTANLHPPVRTLRWTQFGRLFAIRTMFLGHKPG